MRKTRYAGGLQLRFHRSHSAAATLGLRNYEENIRSTESRIRDADVARETADFAKYQILTQVSSAILAQANALSGSVVNLIQ